MKIDIINSLEAKKQELIKFVEQNISTIVPKEYTEVESPIASKQHKVQPMTIIGLCIIVIFAVVYLLYPSFASIVFILVGIVVFACGFLSNKKSTNSKESVVQKEILTQAESIALYNEIKNVIEAMDDNWKSFLAENKDVLKDAIESTSWSSDEKTNYTLKAMATESISYQISDILTNIMKHGKENDEKELNNYIIAMKTNLINSIDKAYSEQLDIYKEILEKLSGKEVV